MTGSGGSAARFDDDVWSSGASPVLVLGEIGVAVPEGLTVLGRHAGQDHAADVDLADWDAAQLVSRRHAELRFGGGVLSVRDLGSANGTRVAGMTLIPERDYPLQPGDTLVVGDVHMTVVAVRAVGRSTPAAARTRVKAGPVRDPVTVVEEPAPVHQARRVAEPPVVVPPPEEPAPLQRPFDDRPLVPPNATMIPAHHRYDDEEAAEEEQPPGRFGAVAERFRRRRDR